MRISPATRKPAGFTMVELLVSTTILAVLVTMLGVIFSQVSRAWITGEGGVERRRSSRALTDFITTELRSAAAPVNRVTTTGQSNLQMLINPATGVLPDDCQNADSIFWQAPMATESTFGDLAEVGYFVRWDPRTPSRRRPTLCRFFVNPSITSTATGESLLPNPLFLVYRNPQWITPPLIDEVAPATPPSYRGLFLENVPGFWVRAFQPDGTELLTNGRRTYDSRTGYRYMVAHGTTQERFLPARIQISIAQVDSHNTVHLDALSEKLLELAKSDEIADAGDFLIALQNAAKADPPMARLLPGLRIHTVEVRLENAR